MRTKAFLSFGLLLTSSQAGFGEDRLRHFNDVHQALSAALASAPSEAQAICQDLPSLPIVSENDVHALYGELKKPKICGDLEPVAQALSQCGDAKYHPLIAAWLAKEKTFFSDRGAKGAYNARSARKLAAREQRLLALLTAAGRGKNKSALPVLRGMLKKGGVYSDEIAVAIGRIGDLADLDGLIEMNERGRKVDLSGFGLLIIDRIIKDVDDPASSSREKDAIIGYLADAKGHETISRYQALIHHKSVFVSKTAVEAIARVAESDDEPLIMRMLKDESPMVRRGAISALMNIWNIRYAPVVIAALKADASEDVRVRAAECLGVRRVCAGEPALRAAIKDGSALVRDAAKSNLASLYNRGSETIAGRPRVEGSQAKAGQLLKDAQSKKKEWQRFAAISELAKAGYTDEAVPLLGDIMSNGTDPVNRAGAIELLRRIGGEKAKAEAAKGLSSSDPWLPRRAAAALSDWIGECDGKPESSVSQ
jgi:HEAT repeat protein